MMSFQEGWAGAGLDAAFFVALGLVAFGAVALVVFLVAFPGEVLVLEATTGVEAEAGAAGDAGSLDMLLLLLR